DDRLAAGEPDAHTAHVALVEDVRRHHLQRERRFERGEDRRGLDRVADDERLRHRDAELREQLLARAFIQRSASLLSRIRENIAIHKTPDRTAKAPRPPRNSKMGPQISSE